MKQSLELKLGQRLTMTPQLQQAIRLLQLSAIDLRGEIQEALETNPLLEETDTGADTAGELEESEQAPGEEPGAEAQAEAADPEPLGDAGFGEAAEQGPPEERDGVDDWETWEPRTTAATHESSASAHDLVDVRNSAPVTLTDHLFWQMRAMPLTELDRHVVEAVIRSIDDDGYLHCELEEIRDIVNAELEEAVRGGGDNGEAELPQVSIEEIEAGLHHVQSFDPPGVAARDLSECLLLQLRNLEPDTPDLDNARVLVEQHLELLAARDYDKLARAMRVDREQLARAVDLVRSLNPRPAAVITAEEPEYVVPDITVRCVRGQWRAELNEAALPSLGINRHYQALIRRGDNSGDNRYLQSQLQEARWFLKSLRNRNETLLRVARAIVERQQEFLERGEEAMKPLVLHDISEELGLHESTVSRATTQKYMLTPRGVFELKYFFSSHVNTADGGSCSATAIRSMIRKIIDTERPEDPVSDSQIARMLHERGIRVARRTVAKYRETMNIPPSNQRKSLV